MGWRTLVPVADDWEEDATRRAKAALISTTVPNAARVADYLYGGQNNFGADRKAARALAATAPVIEAQAVARLDRLAGLSGLPLPGGCLAGILSVTVQSGENGARQPSQVRRRDRHGRGLRGRLVPPGVPLYRTRSQQFDDMVLDAVARLESRWEAELEGVEFAVQEVPEADELVDDSVPLPLARTVPATPGSSDPASPATRARIVVYRRPLMARSENEGELSDLVFDVVVEEFANFLGLDPDSVDPGYRGGLD
jgi:predicted Zn-dependent protease with MMP-like domain